MPLPNVLLSTRNKWANCHACPYGCRTTTRPFYRGNSLVGSDYLDLLLVGEAPGKREDLEGQPFVGPSGKLLGYLIQDTQRRLRWRYRYGIVNTVLCTPWNDSKPPEIEAPPSDVAVKACEDRVREVVEVLPPKVLVALGKTAERYILERNIHSDLGCPLLLLKHPAWVLRKGGATSLTYKKWMFAFLDELTAIKEQNNEQRNESES